MNLHRRQRRKRRRDHLFVTFVYLCKNLYLSFGGMLAVLGLAGLSLTASATGAGAPKRGGTLRFAGETDPRSLDPATIFSNEEGIFTCLLFNGLFDLDAVGNVVPMLAETLPTVSPDALTYTLQLRPGVVFSHGRAATADDVVFTLERLLDPSTGSPEAGYLRAVRGSAAFVDARQKEATLLAQGSTNHVGRWIAPTTVEGLRALDQRTVEIQLEQPDLALIPILAAPYAAILPRDVVEQRGDRFRTQPVGTGPFVLREWLRGVRLRFDRNPRYFHRDEPHLDAIEVPVNVDWTTQAIMFERGELDVQSAITDPDLLRFRKNPGLQTSLNSVVGVGPLYVSINCELAPFTNRLVRIALNHAIDKEALLRRFLQRAVPTCSVIPKCVRGTLDSPPYAHDPARARSLLVEAGFTTGFETTLWVGRQNANYVKAALLIQEDLRKVGITVRLKEVSISALFDAIMRRRTVPMGVMDMVGSVNDPKEMLDALLNGDNIVDQNCLNTAFYSNDAVQRLFRAASIDADAARRTQRYQEIERLIIQDAPWLFLCQLNAETIRQPWLKGLRTQGLWPTVRLESAWLER